MRCHIQGQGFGNKMYISKLFTVVGYLHTAGFKNRRGINCAKCTLRLQFIAPCFMARLMGDLMIGNHFARCNVT